MNEGNENIRRDFVSVSNTERATRLNALENGIYLATKGTGSTSLFLLTDNNHYTAQLYVKLEPKNHGLVIHAPVCGCVGTIYIPKFPGEHTDRMNKKINHSLAL